MTNALSTYDGSAGVLVDTNVWIDCIDEESSWHGWAIDRLQECSARAPLPVNIVIYAELPVPKTDVQALNALIRLHQLLSAPRVDCFVSAAGPRSALQRPRQRIPERRRRRSSALRAP